MSPVVAKEVAESEFERMCKARRIVTDPSELDAAAQASIVAHKADFVAVMMRGHLVVNADGDPVYTPPVPGAKPVTFYMPTGATFMAMDTVDGSITKTVAALTDMTRSNRGELSKMAAPDFRVCMELAKLFLAQ